MSIRPIKRVIEARPTIEGAGVRLRRAFGFGETEDFDPFLLFDDFRNESKSDEGRPARVSYVCDTTPKPSRGVHVYSTGKADRRIQTNDGRRGRTTAAGLWLW